MGNQASFSNLLSYLLIDNCASNTQVSLTMADLRLVVLGCLMLVAFAQSQQICEKAQPGEILQACLFTHKCPISTYDDLKKVLARDLKSIRYRLSGALGAMIECVGTIEMTGKSSSGKGSGCCDEKMVKTANGGKGCKVACDAAVKLLPYSM